MVESGQAKAENQVLAPPSQVKPSRNDAPTTFSFSEDERVSVIESRQTATDRETWECEAVQSLKQA